MFSLFSEPELIPNEVVLHRKGSNFIVKLDEVDLPRFCADQLMWTIGMAGKEAIGGHLYITNYRLLFIAHKFNRLTGQFSIPLFRINDAYKKTKFPMFKLLVETDMANFEFVIWNANKAVEIIRSNQTNAPENLEEILKENLRQNTPLCFINALFMPKETLKARWNDFMSN